MATVNKRALDELKILPPEDLYVFQAFMPGGWLSKHIDDYQMREGQLRLAQKVDAVFKHSRDLIAEGPTGIGKSMAYAVPLAYHTAKGALHRGVIVTANIALQEQLVNKDLPLLQKALPWEFKFALHKGRNNYLCKDALRNLYEKENNKVRLHLHDEQEGTDHHKRIASWATTTETGDVSELPFEPKSQVWSRFSVTSEECLGKACKDFQNCWSNHAYNKLSAMQISVTNYHIFFAQLKMGGGALNYDYVVFDEAHKAADIARDFFGFTIHEGTFKWVTSRIHDNPRLKKEIEMSANLLFNELRNHKVSGNYKTRLKDPSVIHVSALLDQLDRLEHNFAVKERSVGNLVSQADRDSNASSETKFKLQRMHHEAQRARKTVHRLTEDLCLLGTLNEDYVYYLEEERNRFQISAKKIDIGNDLGEAMFPAIQDPKQTQRASPNSVVLMSATLSVGGSFDHITKDLGMGQAFTDLFVAESPFDWQKQAKLIVPEDLPDPKNREEFRKAVGMALSYIVEQAQGRTLGLFTSWVGLNSAYEILKTRSKYTILKQGDMPRAKLIEEFKRDHHSVLLGVESFWQGIDVPGDALACVVIDKLPFPSMEDPILDALQAKYDAKTVQDVSDASNPFRTYSIPRMILSLKQGFGRLIRGVGDRGVVVVLDKRIHTSWDSYGRVLIHSLPPAPRSTDLDDVARFLK